MEKGNMDGARIYAQNAIRLKNQSLNYLKLSSRIDAVAARVNTAVQTGRVCFVSFHFISCLKICLCEISHNICSILEKYFGVFFFDRSGNW